ncbi:MAG: hypothetical protein LUC24_02695, partial [Bacteroidales bacterium]|nr:hypothetical protein [Bacteroidales bacterium]
MKRILSILSFVAVVAFGAGCTVYDTADVEYSSGVNLQEGIFDKVMTPFCRIVDLTDFYYRYRNIANDE